MKINVRNGVFETNSSSSHMFTFCARKSNEESGLNAPERQAIMKEWEGDFYKIHKKNTYSGLLKKFEILSFVIESVDMDGNFVSTKKLGQINLLYENLAAKMNKKSKDIIEEISKILGIENININDEGDMAHFNSEISKLIIKNEKEFFAKINYNYPVAIEENCGKEVVIDNLTDKERITLALKYIIFENEIHSRAVNSVDYEDRVEHDKLDPYYNEKRYNKTDEFPPEEKIVKKYKPVASKSELQKVALGLTEKQREAYFFDILNKKITPNFVKLYGCLFELQMLNENIMHKAFKEVICSLDKKSQEICDSGNPWNWLEGHLTNSYFFHILELDFNIDCSCEAKFKESAKKFLMDDDIVIDMQ